MNWTQQATMEPIEDRIAELEAELQRCNGKIKGLTTERDEALEGWAVP